MMVHSRVLFSLAALSVISLAAEADRQPGEATVTVSAEAQPVEVVRTPAPVHIVEAEEMARLGSRTLGELLEVLQPGALMPSGGVGANASAFLNGTLSRNVVVLLDGMRLNDPTAVSPDLGALSLIGIGRVELILGPSSVLYGSDAIGGVIALTSVGRGAEGFHGQTGLKLGTDGQIGGTAQVQLSSTKGWIAAGAEALKQNNGFPNDTFQQAGGFLRLGTTLGTAELTGFYRNSGQTASVPFNILYTSFPFLRDYEPGRETQARQESWGASLRWTLAPEFVLENTFQALSGKSADPNGPLRQQTDRDFRRVEDQLTLHWTPTQAFRLSGRIEGREDTSHARNYYDPSVPPFGANVLYRGEGHDLAGAMESRWTLAEGLDWVAGLRRDGGHRDLTRLDSDLRSRAGSAEASTWRSGLNWVVRPELRLYASAGQGFRMPNTTEFALNAQAESQDGKVYPIVPERSRTVQIGATGLCAGHWEYRLEAQRTRISDLLAYLYDPTVFTDHYANQGHVRAQSLEGALGWRGGTDVAHGWELILHSQETRDLDHNVAGQRFGSVDDSAIVRHPFFTGALSAFAQTKTWRGDIRINRVGSRYDLSDTTGDIIPIKPYHDLSLGLSHEPRKGLTLALRGEHLLQPKQTVQDWLSGRYDQNGNAALVYGFPAQGPRWTLAATWRW